MSIEIEKSLHLAASLHGGQKYDKYLPYEYHLRMAIRFGEKFIDDIIISRMPHIHELKESILIAIAFHDVLEDTNIKFAELKKLLRVNFFSDFIADTASEIVYSVTEEKGRNRKERLNANYYAGIRETKYAVFVKLCDQLANVFHGSVFNSEKLEMYREEHKHFISELRDKKGIDSNIDYTSMFQHLHWLKFEYEF